MPELAIENFNVDYPELFENFVRDEETELN